MNLLLAGLTWQSCLVYIDDIIIFSADFATHRRDLEEVLQRLIRAGFLLKGKKCRFAVDRVEYLGHIVTAQGISPDPAKIAKLRAFPIPTSVTEVRAFLGLAGYYRKFIRDFSIIAGPLFDLLKDKAPFDWEEPQRRAFTTLIDAWSRKLFYFIHSSMSRSSLTLMHRTKDWEPCVHKYGTA